MVVLTFVIALLAFVALAFFRASLASWALAVVLVVFSVFVVARISDDLLLLIGGGMVLIFGILGLPVLRRTLISTPLLNYFRRQLPEVPLATEVLRNSWTQALFNGHPDWKTWLALPKAGLSAAEQSFLTQEVAELCALLSTEDEQSPVVQAFLQDQGFLSLELSAEAGGLGFSALARARIVSKIAAHHHAAAALLMEQSPNLLLAACCVGDMQQAIEASFQQATGGERALASMAAQSYLMDSTLQLTAFAHDQGTDVTVMMEILRYYAAHYAREVLLDAVDIQQNDAAFKTILIATAPTQILSQQIFSTSVLGAHRYAAKELGAAQHQNSQLAQLKFDAAFREHFRSLLSHAARSWVFGLTGGFGMIVPGGYQTPRYYQQLTRFSAAFALCTDVTLMVAGRAADQYEALFSRLGIVFAQLYLCAAALKRFEDDNRPKADLPKLEWAMQHALYQIQQTLLALIHNLPNGAARGILRALVFPLGARLTLPSDALGKKVLHKA